MRPNRSSIGWSARDERPIHRIAQLVVEGMKNREVADAMFISVKTVEANLSRIFHKLGVRSRTELTRRIVATYGQQTTSTEAGT